MKNEAIADHLKFFNNIQSVKIAYASLNPTLPDADLDPEPCTVESSCQIDYSSAPPPPSTAFNMTFKGNPEYEDACQIQLNGK